MFENLNGLRKGLVWSDFSDLIGQSIQYEEDIGKVVCGVVKRLVIYEEPAEEMVTPVGIYLDVYAEIGCDCVLMGTIFLFGRGWTWQGIDSVIDNELLLLGHPVYLSEDSGIVLCGDMVIPVFADGSLDMDNVCPLSECIFDYEDCVGGE